MSEDHERLEREVDKLGAKVDGFLIFTGEMGKAVKSIEGDVSALFAQSKEVLAALNELKLKTSVETTKLNVKYGFIGVLIGAIPTTIAAVILYFKFKK